jgi:hypothetical protein
MKIRRIDCFQRKLTARRFLAQFPDSTPNHGLLETMIRAMIPATMNGKPNPTADAAPAITQERSATLPSRASKN